jgi:hypothetical protein
MQSHRCPWSGATVAVGLSTSCPQKNAASPELDAHPGLRSMYNGKPSPDHPPVPAHSPDATLSMGRDPWIAVCLPLLVPPLNPRGEPFIVRLSLLQNLQ